MEIEEKIQVCIASILKADLDDIKGLSKDEPMNRIGLNSLNFIDCIISLEQHFGIIFDDEELLLDNLNTINKISGIIIRKLNELN